jgi:sortase A
MSVRLIVEEAYCAPHLRWRISRALFLLIGVGALGYAGLIYVQEYLHQRSASEAFDRARGNPTFTKPAPQTEAPAEPFRAKLVIERLNLQTMVEEGVGEDILRYTAGHIPRTALPGQVGNVGVAAHRDTLFRKLKGIRKHDRIVLSTPARNYSYEVTATVIVRPDDVSVLASTRSEKTLTLVTCYPFYFVGSAPKRFVVRAQQIAETPAASTDD